MNKKKAKLLLFILVALTFLLMYLILYYGVIPKAGLDNTDVEMMWLIPAVKVLKYLLWAGFTVSLYFIGRTIHFDKPPYSEQAAVTGKDAYYMAADILDSLKAKQVSSDIVVKEVKRIHDILKNDSGFGVGIERVISCETEIYSLLEKLGQYTRMYCTQTGSEEARQKSLECCVAINGKLRLRMELKKR